MTREGMDIRFVMGNPTGYPLSQAAGHHFDIGRVGINRRAVCPTRILPGVWLKRSQIDGPRPSSLTAPSIWYEAVAVPHRKSGGNRRASNSGWVLSFESDCIFASLAKLTNSVP